MKELKKTFFITFFCIEMVLFMFFYAFGTHGIQALRHLEKENQSLRCNNAQMRQDIQMLEQECNAWETSSFNKEKIARERLQMAGTGDVIYYVD